MEKIIVEVEGMLAARIKCIADVWGIDTVQLALKLLNDGLVRSDQTEDEWLWGAGPEDLGTGIFLVPDVKSNESGSVEKVFVPNITYQDYVKRMNGAVIGKWVPQSISSYKELSSSSCSYGSADKD